MNQWFEYKKKKEKKKKEETTDNKNQSDDEDMMNFERTEFKLSENKIESPDAPCHNNANENKNISFIEKFFPLKIRTSFPFGHGIGFEELFLLGIILALSNQ